MMYPVITYLRFLLSSSNQHGVHSPFVYNFVTRCLYTKSNYKGGRCLRVLLKSIAYFKAQKVSIPPHCAQLREQVKNSFPYLDLNPQTADIIYMDSPSMKLFSSILKKGGHHNDTMVLINNIHQNKGNTQNWLAIKNHMTITVSVDLFYCGALFFRKEQVKEHFKIRI